MFRRISVIIREAPALLQILSSARLTITHLALFGEITSHVNLSEFPALTCLELRHSRWQLLHSLGPDNGLKSLVVYFERLLMHPEPAARLAEMDALVASFPMPSLQEVEVRFGGDKYELEAIKSYCPQLLARGLLVHNDDPPRSHSVSEVFFVKTANTALNIDMIYDPLILHYGALPINLPTVFIMQPICVMLVGFPIQLFFIWRIRTLTGQNVTPFADIPAKLRCTGGGLWTTVRIPAVAEFRRVPILHTSATVWLIGSAGTDLCIAFSLAIPLKKMKTGLAATDTVVDKIIRMIVQTGMLAWASFPSRFFTVLKHLFNSALFSVLDVVSFLTIANATVNFMWNIPISKVYSNCLMSTLSARQAWNKNMGDNSLLSFWPHALPPIARLRIQ
ncbi:hypothetical protein DFH09DRAFT_1372072 [Mycena vulgaris]|nr:hypothetical protein DFH09DRAFT_1372072 [Mycena vulgaris]